MHKIPQALYDLGHMEIDRRVEELLQEASRLPRGTKQQSLLIEAAKFNTYSDIKRWLAQPPKPVRSRIGL